MKYLKWLLFLLLMICCTSCCHKQIDEEIQIKLLVYGYTTEESDFYVFFVRDGRLTATETKDKDISYDECSNDKKSKSKRLSAKDQREIKNLAEKIRNSDYSKENMISIVEFPEYVETVIDDEHYYSLYASSFDESNNDMQKLAHKLVLISPKKTDFWYKYYALRRTDSKLWKIIDIIVVNIENFKKNYLWYFL